MAQHHDRGDSRGGFVNSRGRSSCCIHRGFDAVMRSESGVGMAKPDLVHTS